MQFVVRILAVTALMVALGSCTKSGEKRAVDSERVAAGEDPAAARPSFVFADASESARAPERQARAPISLTASDGTGLTLSALHARGVLEPPLAFTELHMTFENPENRVIEGRFEILLPPRASISRLAMKIGDHWQEGEVVERQAARQAYEDFLHRRQDPALLEQQSGNRFTARVFPIPARGTKELILSYSQELVGGTAGYRIPLAGLPELGELSLRVFVDRQTSEVVSANVPGNLGGTKVQHEVVKVEKTAWTPDEDFELPGAEGAHRLGLRHDNLVVARVTPVAELIPEQISSLLILVDSSASRALHYERQIGLVERLVDGLSAGAGPDVPIAVGVYDQSAAIVYAGSAGRFGAGERKRLRERMPLGASDLHRALATLADTLRDDGGKYERLVVITDGVATAGKTDGDEIIAAAKALGAFGVQRLDAVVVGGLRDDEILARLVTAGLPRDGTVIEGELGVEMVAQRLMLATHSGLPVNVPGAAWVWPETIDGVQAGEQVLIYADLAKERPFEVTIAGNPVPEASLPIATAKRPLLHRAWVGARIRRLSRQRDTLAAGDDDLRDGLKKQIVDLSVQHRVVSPYTALLVLETESDYRRFEIERRGLADIMTIGPSGLEVTTRSYETLLGHLQSQRAAKASEVRNRFFRLFAGESEGAFLGAGESGDIRGGTLSEILGAAAEDGSAQGIGGLGISGAPSARPGIGGIGTAGRLGGGGQAYGSGVGIGRRRDRGIISIETPVVMGSLPREVIKRVIRQHKNQIRYCYEVELQRNPSLEGRIAVKWVIAATGSVPRVRIESSTLGNQNVERCIMARIKTWKFPAPAGGGIVEVNYPFVFRTGVVEERPPPPMPGGPPSSTQPKSEEPLPALTGELAEIDAKLQAGSSEAAREQALAWRRKSPGDVLALIALGRVFEALHDATEAARAYGSLIDLFPARADVRRHAGQRLESLKTDASLALAIDTYEKAVEQRPDHPTSHRLYALALARAARYDEAFDALTKGLARKYPGGRFAGVRGVLNEDLGLVAAAWARAQPEKKDEIAAALSKAGGKTEDGPSLRFVLSWETDANDVDLHVHDARGGHAFYSSRQLPSGGRLYEDVTTGYGPECFTVRKEADQRAYPYRVRAHYYSRGPMGYGMGTLQVVEHDGKGALSFRARPFVVMQDRAFFELGEFGR